MYFQKYNCRYFTIFLLRDFKGHLRKWVLKMFRQTIVTTKLNKLIPFFFFWRFSKKLDELANLSLLMIVACDRTESEFGMGTTAVFQQYILKAQYSRNSTLKVLSGWFSLGRWCLVFAEQICTISNIGKKNLALHCWLISTSSLLPSIFLHFLLNWLVC